MSEQTIAELNSALLACHNENAKLRMQLEKAVEILKEIDAKKGMTIYSYSREFMDGAHSANNECAAIAREFLAELEKENGNE